MNTTLKTAVCAMAITAAALPSAADSSPISDPRGGAVTGRVVSTDNQTLPGASIYITSIHTGAVSNDNGFYSLSNLKPGSYNVRVSYIGYKPVEMKIEVPDGKTVSYNFVLTPSGYELGEAVVVSAMNGQSRAINLQKNKMGIVNVVSADQVGKFPDSNIGDALKRISGINVQYDQGEARFAQVRGTSADLTSVTVNGNRLPSAEGDTRNVQLDLIPSDMVQTIEVNKVVTADMDGDAIGGAVNLVTKSTPYHRVFNATLGTGYSSVSGKPMGNAGLTWGNRYADGRFGIMLAGSYQYNPGGSDNTEFEYVAGEDGKPVLKEAQVRQYYVTRERQSYSLALDYVFNPSHKISFKGIYNRRNDWENRYRLSYKKLNDSKKKQSVVFQTKAGSDDEKNARLERQQTMDFTLDGEHLFFGTLSMDWAASYSRATEGRPNERYVGFAYKGYDDYGASFKDVDGRQPYSTIALPDVSDKGWELDELNNSNQDITENEYKGRINFSLPLVKGLYGNTLKFGAKFVQKDKERVTSFYDYDEEVIGDWRSHLTYQIRDGFMPGSQYPEHVPFVDKKYLGSIDFSKFKGTENYEEEAGNYNATERVMSEYVRFDQKLGSKLTAVAGLRIEHTSLKTHGMTYEVSEDANGDDVESFKPTGEFKHNYTDVLPSLLLKYDATKDFRLRASFTKTLSRPKYSALVANKIFNLKDEEATIGDPNTAPATSLNYDLSAEYYFESIGLVSAGVFYKDVKNVNVPVTGYVKGSALGLGKDYADTDFEVTQDLNAYDARIFGVEVAWQRDFSFIAPALRCVGLYANYTYTHSSTHDYNSRLGVKDGDDVRMAGSPEHTANASLYFEKWGLQARLSYNHASSFIDQMNLQGRDFDRYYDSVDYLDLNASYTWGKKTRFTVYAEATNLLNQPLRYYQGSKDRTMQVEYYGARFNAGFKINL